MQPTQVSSPTVDEHKLRQQVVPHVQQIDPSYNLAKATPATAPNHQDDSDLVENIEHALKMGRSAVTGESIWSRIGKAFRGASILKKRKMQKATLNPKDYQSDLDIGD